MCSLHFRVHDLRREVASSVMRLHHDCVTSDRPSLREEPFATVGELVRGPVICAVPLRPISILGVSILDVSILVVSILGVSILGVLSKCAIVIVTGH